jgi:hypothetical protein
MVNDLDLSAADEAVLRRDCTTCGELCGCAACGVPMVLTTRDGTLDWSSEAEELCRVHAPQWQSIVKAIEREAIRDGHGISEGTWKMTFIAWVEGVRSLEPTSVWHPLNG